jgi:tetratricopeptide (TPR) repeat protein
VDTNPAVTEFQSELAYSHSSVGLRLSQIGKPAEALKELQKALAIQQKLVDANPAVVRLQFVLSAIYRYMGRLHAQEKRFNEAFAAQDRGLAIDEKLADAYPTTTMYVEEHGYSHAYRGWAQVRAGHPALATADLRRALALWEKAKATGSETEFERGRALALLAGMAADAKSGVTTTEASRFTDQAVAALRDALEAGWGQYDELKGPDFDALRGRDDFKKLLAEVEARNKKTTKDTKNTWEDRP